MAVVAFDPRATGRARYALAGSAFAVGAVAVYLAAQRAEPPTTYAAASTAAFVADVIAGIAALAAGLIAVAARPRGAVGLLTLAIGVSWFAADWVGWEDGPAIVRSVGMVVSPFAAAFAVHLVIAYPSGRLPGGVARLTVAVVYGATMLTSVGRALFRDPWLDLHCWSNCTDNVFLVRADRGLTRWFNSSGLRVTVVSGWVAAVAAGWRLARMTTVARRSTWFVIAPAAAAGLAFAAYAMVLLRDAAEDPTATKFFVAFLLRALAVVAIAGGVIWGVVRLTRTRRAVTHLAESLGAAPPPGSLRDMLARSLGDDRLEVAYWIPGSHCYLDADGRQVDPVLRRGQASTAIVRRGQPLAIVVHDAALQAEHNLAREIGASARLAVDNERLRAEVLAQLNDLRASRARIVASSDATRRRLERDLHDGAQQRLLAVLYELRLASAAAAGDGDSATGERIAALGAEVGQAISELRELAHGIYPAILVESGLGPALSTLADKAPVTVEVAHVVEQRYSAAVEAAAYLVVAEAVREASATGATLVVVRVEEGERRLVVSVGHDGGRISDDVAVHLADHIGALGGEVDINDGGVRTVIPCAP